MNKTISIIASLLIIVMIGPLLIFDSYETIQDSITPYSYWILVAAVINIVLNGIAYKKETAHSKSLLFYRGFSAILMTFIGLVGAMTILTFTGVGFSEIDGNFEFLIAVAAAGMELMRNLLVIAYTRGDVYKKIYTDYEIESNMRTEEK